MKIFTIENETNNITLHGTVPEAEAVENAEHFGKEAALAKLAANWPRNHSIPEARRSPSRTTSKAGKPAN